jgi:hypothetical protein
VSQDLENSDLETWGAYRKLIVDTQKRLDDRTMEIYTTQSKHETRLSVIESIEIEDKIKDLTTDVEKLKGSKQETDGKKSIIVWLAGGIASIITAGLTLLAEGKIHLS